ncbi:type VI secretion system baseplate subunit TssF [Proteus mirabilis]
MSEIKYIKEKQYLQKLFSEYADKAPHLASVLDPQDPQTSYLLEGFAFYLLVYKIKLMMLFLRSHYPYCND